MGSAPIIQIHASMDPTPVRKSHRVTVHSDANLSDNWIICIYPDRKDLCACTALRSDETHWTNTICKAATGRSNARRLVNLFLLSFLSNQKFMRSTIKIDIEINSRRTDCPTSKRTQHTKTKCKKSSENFTCKTVLRVCGASLHFVQECVRVCPVEMLRQSFTVNCPSQSVSIFFVSPPD